MSGVLIFGHLFPKMSKKVSRSTLKIVLKTTYGVSTERFKKPSTDELFKQTNMRIYQRQALEECCFKVLSKSQSKTVRSLEDVTFCKQTNAYQHCHAHIIEDASTTFQPPPEQLPSLKKMYEGPSVIASRLLSQMKARHSPFNRFIRIGQTPSKH